MRETITMNNKNIILVGFMGVGKSTLARKLAKELKTICLDTDKIIENMESRKITKIFEKKGEAYFRELEKKVALWLQENVQNSVISAGGGFTSSTDLKKIGKVVYLKSTFEGIIKKISEHPKAKAKFEKRPLLQDRKKAKELFKKRESQYEKSADIVIDVEKYADIKELLKETIKLLHL
jgi:shikimate kinase